jgi:DNA repair exonuclease SbcCD ATPase subunit
MCNPKGTQHFVINPGSTERCGTCDRRKGMCFLRNHVIGSPTTSVGGTGGTGKGPGKGKGQGKGTSVRGVSLQEPRGPRQDPTYAEVEKLKATVAKLQGEVLKAKAVVGAPAAGVVVPAVAGKLKSSADIDKELADMVGEAGATADLVRKQLLAAREAGVLREEEAEIVQLRKDIAALENMADVQTVKDRKQARLDHLVEAKRMAKPLSTRIKDVEELCERRAKAVAKAQADAEGSTRELEEAQKRMDEAAQEVRSREEKLQEAEATRAELYKQKADEFAAGGGRLWHVRW